MKLDITTIAALAEQLEDCQLQAKDTVMITYTGNFNHSKGKQIPLLLR